MWGLTGHRPLPEDGIWVVHRPLTLRSPDWTSFEARGPRAVNPSSPPFLWRPCFTDQSDSWWDPPFWFCHLHVNWWGPRGSRRVWGCSVSSPAHGGSGCVRSSGPQGECHLSGPLAPHLGPGCSPRAGSRLSVTCGMQSHGSTVRGRGSQSLPQLSPSALPPSTFTCRQVGGGPGEDQGKGSHPKKPVL